MIPHEVAFVVLHCAATPAHLDIGATEIRHWHTAPKPVGNGWRHIGYHFIIRRSGIIEIGLALRTQGIHVAGHNYHSVGVCLVGGARDGQNAPGFQGVPEANFVTQQLESLRDLSRTLLRICCNAVLVGHNELDPSKPCPSFDVRQWYNEGMSITRPLPALTVV